MQSWEGIQVPGIPWQGDEQAWMLPSCLAVGRFRIWLQVYPAHTCSWGRRRLQLSTLQGGSPLHMWPGLILVELGLAPCRLCSALGLPSPAGLQVPRPRLSPGCRELPGTGAGGRTSSRSAAVWGVWDTSLLWMGSRVCKLHGALQGGGSLDVAGAQAAFSPMSCLRF